MDTAYDAIQQESLAEASNVERAGGSTEVDAAVEPAGQSLSEEITDVVNTIQQTAWGARIGGLWDAVKKQGEVALDITKKDLSVASELATKEFASLSEQLRSSHIASQVASQASQVATQASALVSSTAGRLSMDGGERLRSAEIRRRVKIAPASTSKMFAVLKQKAQVQMEELEKVEFAKYLNQVGKDVGEFLKDAVTVEPGEDSEYAESGAAVKDVLFDVPEDIKRQIYTTRLDAQLHALHTSAEPFVTEADEAYTAFAAGFSVEAQTGVIAADLEHYPELRKLMEKLVPEKSTYDEFWKRYYFLREQINQEELRRKQLLTAAGETDENFDWDEEDEEEEESPAPVAEKSGRSTMTSNSTDTLKPDEHDLAANDAGSKTGSSRPSSESSYDLVSAVNSQPDLRATATTAAAAAEKAKPAGDEDEEEEDWE